MKRPLRDQRLARPEFRHELQRRAHEAGWQEIGGRLIRDTEGKPVGRTDWVPFSEWYARMQQTPEARIPLGQWGVARAVSLALKGEPMNPQQRRSVVWMLNDFESYAAWSEEEYRAAAEQVAA